MKIRITPGAILLALAMLHSGGYLLPVTLICVGVHEAGHLLAAAALGVRVRLLELDIPGARIVTATPFSSYRAEGIVAAAGPLFSFIGSCLFLPCRGAFADSLATTGLSLCLFNLLPIEGFDGGRILSSLLTPPLGDICAKRVLCVTGYLSLLLLFSLSSCLLLRYGENATLAILSASLFVKLFLHARG